jgi:hypothetical protein
MVSAMMIHDDVYIGKRKEVLKLLDFLHAGERLKRAKQKHVTVAYAQQWRTWWERADFGNLTNPAGFANEAIRQGHAPPQQRYLPEGVLFTSDDFVWSPPEVAALPDQDSQAWTTTLTHLEGQMTRATFDTWLRGTAPLRREEETLIIGVKCDQAKAWLDNRLHKIISRAAAAQGLDSIRFEVRAATNSEIRQEIEL